MAGGTYGSTTDAYTSTDLVYSSESIDTGTQGTYGSGNALDKYGSHAELTYAGSSVIVPPPPPPPPPDPPPTSPPGPGPDGTGETGDPAIPAPDGSPYRFTPPADVSLGPISMYPPTIRANPLGTRLMAHFRGAPRAVNVYKLADGTYTTQQPTPTPVNHATVPANQRVVHRYRGGTTEAVSAQEKAALEAAGYVVETIV